MLRGESVRVFKAGGRCGSKGWVAFGLHRGVRVPWRQGKGPEGLD
jgi:hypothetical protein